MLQNETCPLFLSPCTLLPVTTLGMQEALSNSKTAKKDTFQPKKVEETSVSVSCWSSVWIRELISLDGTCTWPSAGTLCLAS